MKLTQKIGLLFKIRKPAGAVLDSIKDVKRGYRKIGFWVALLGSLLGCAAAVADLMPPEAALIVTAVLTAAYNVVKGLQSTEKNTQSGTFISSTFILSTLAIVQTALMTIHEGGVKNQWLILAMSVIGATLSAGQNLAGVSPAAPVEVVKAPEIKELKEAEEKAA